MARRGHAVPVGLIDATWGGTIIEAWSPPEVLEACDVADEGLDGEHNHNNYLWNGMIQPLTHLAIRGALWYQGESNTGHNMEIYDCLFENLISSWRQRWFETTEGGMDLSFPFGFVQLGPNTDNKHSFRWPQVRWKQTGEYGFVPNQRLQNVFMAAAMDDDIAFILRTRGFRPPDWPGRGWPRCTQTCTSLLTSPLPSSVPSPWGMF